MDVDSEVVPVGVDGLAGVHAHAHAQLAAFGPVVVGEGALKEGCGIHGGVRLLECHEELVAAGIDLGP